MIVVCTGCSAKFRVADEKVGPRGAKLRCSKCQTVFTVQQEIEVPTAPVPGSVPEPAPAPVSTSTTAGTLRATPPPLPRRATTLDARAVFDVDLELGLGAPPEPSDPFAPHPPEPRAGPAGTGADPFTPPLVSPAPTHDPFGLDALGGPPEDPFGAPAAAELEAPPPPAPAAAGVGASSGASIFLEELTTPPARRFPRTALTGPAPMPMIAASEDPFASTAFDPGLSVLDEGVLASAVPQAGSDARTSVEARHADAEPEPPLQLDPFGAAAVAADPLAVDEPRRAAAPQPPVETTAERKAAARSFRLRDVLVSAMALAVLLLLSLAILVIGRGGLAPSDAHGLSSILGALGPRLPAGALIPSGVTSGLYERARGAPLLFVRGTVVSTASTPFDEVTVVVEVVRDGAVLVRGEVPVGAVPGPEALSAAVDGAELARALAAAAAPGGAGLAPGASAPFLVAFADFPANLAGASLRVRAVANR